MDLADRQSIARELCQRLATVADVAIVVAGMVAPAAPPTDFDPLELLVITERVRQRPMHSFMMRGIPVTINTIALPDLEVILQVPDLRWPQWLSWLAQVQPIIGTAEQVQDWLSRARALPERAFYQSIIPYLPQLVFRRYSELRAATVRRQASVARLLVSELLMEMISALCLINRCWLTQHRYAGLNESFSFPLQPRDWPQLATALIAAQELDEIGRLAGTLIGNYWQLLVRCSLQVENHQTIASAPL
mgnify:CR=1 FL=1